MQGISVCARVRLLVSDTYLDMFPLADNSDCLFPLPKRLNKYNVCKVCGKYVVSGQYMPSLII